MTNLLRGRYVSIVSALRHNRLSVLFFLFLGKEERDEIPLKEKSNAQVRDWPSVAWPGPQQEPKVIMSSCKIMAAGAQKDVCFQQLQYWLGRNAVNVRLSHSHIHTPQAHPALCSKLCRIRYLVRTQDPMNGFKRTIRATRGIQSGLGAVLSPWCRSSCREPAWLGLEGGISEPGTSPLGVKDMWQFQPVSRPIFSANTYRRADKRVECSYQGQSIADNVISECRYLLDPLG